MLSVIKLSFKKIPSAPSASKYFKMANSSYISDLDYDEFQNIIEIGKGKNSVADWTKHNNRIVLKNLNSKEEFIQEVKVNTLC